MHLLPATLICSDFWTRSKPISHSPRPAKSCPQASRWKICFSRPQRSLRQTGETAEATALNNLIAEVSGLSGTIILEDLLSIDFPEGALADIDLNALDLITGLVQLYNYENVATTPTPITISGASLSGSGLDVVADTVRLYAQVIEPQVIVCGSGGETAHTAAIRSNST